MEKQSNDPSGFREEMFRLYGFTDRAMNFIRRNSIIIVYDFGSTAGGGGWYPDNGIVELATAQHEAAVHELSHVWWHYFRLENQDFKKSLCRDVVKLSEMNPDFYPEFQAAIQFAYEYVHGNENWLGMYGNQDYGLCRDAHNLTEDDFLYRINDWEIFAGFCSWTMGLYKYGPRALPQFLWKYFEPLFTGVIQTTPYYLR